MKATTGRVRDNIGSICVSMPTLMKMLDCGRPTAETLAIAAGAKIKIGKRALYNVDKIKHYVNTESQKRDI